MSDSTNRTLPAAIGLRSVHQPSVVTVGNDGRATFRLHLPGSARQVQVAGKGGDSALGPQPHDLTRGEGDRWTAQIGPVAPGCHYYEFLVDGAPWLSPRAEVHYGWDQLTHCLEVPAVEQDFAAACAVPHGRVQTIWYESRIAGTLRRVLVYTPPQVCGTAALGCETGLGQRHTPAREGSQPRAYAREPLRCFAVAQAADMPKPAETPAPEPWPVLYLRHGAGENETVWTLQGRTNFILDNLIAAGRCAPMAVVMECGYVARPGAPDPHRPERDENAFEEALLTELMPEIERQFPVAAERRGRAIAGLSMGSFQSLLVGLRHLDVFGAVGGFSGGIRQAVDAMAEGGVLADAARANAALDLLWMGCGRSEPMLEAGREMHEQFAKSGIRHEWHEYDGAHEWRVWRQCLRDFASGWRPGAPRA